MSSPSTQAVAHVPPHPVMATFSFRKECRLGLPAQSLRLDAVLFGSQDRDKLRAQHRHSILAQARKPSRLGFSFTFDRRRAPHCSHPMVRRLLFLVERQAFDPASSSVPCTRGFHWRSDTSRGHFPRRLRRTRNFRWIGRCMSGAGLALTLNPKPIAPSEILCQYHAMRQLEESFRKVLQDRQHKRERCQADFRPELQILKPKAPKFKAPNSKPQIPNLERERCQ
jgi:hypothetical protein